MRGRLAGGMRFWLLAVLPFLAYFQGISAYRELRELPAAWQIVCRDGGVEEGTCGDILQALEEEKRPQRCAFWELERARSLQNPRLNRGAELSVLQVRGSVELLTGDFVRLSEEDVDGCYLDRASAEELFGSADVVGKQLLWEEKNLTVRGILRGGERMLLIRPPAGEQMERMTLEGDFASSALAAEEFAGRFGIGGECCGDAFLEDILRLLLLLFPALAAASFLGGLGKTLERWEGTAVWEEAGRALWWAALIFLLWLLFRFVQIPEEMIPDRWSNFEFWKNWWESFTENIRLYTRMEKTGRDVWRLSCFGRGTFCALLAAALWRRT